MSKVNHTMREFGAADGRMIREETDWVLCEEASVPRGTGMVQSVEAVIGDRSDFLNLLKRQFELTHRMIRMMTLQALVGPTLPQDIGPTTACFDCGAIIPIGDCFYSSTVDQRALCEGCYGKAEKAGRAKCQTK